MEDSAWMRKENPDSIWRNDIYQVIVYKHQTTAMEDILVTWLSIKRIDRQPCNDWRHFQFIKNQLVGEENEAVQIYPAESRLVDGANQYHLWVLEDANIRLPFGFTDGRMISEHPAPGGKQRAWPKNMRPKDMDEQNRKIRELLEKHRKI